MKREWYINSLPPNDAELPSSDNSLRKLKQRDFYLTSDPNGATTIREYYGNFPPCAQALK